MKLSKNWLHEWVKSELTPAQLAEQLTLAGLEVESIQNAAADFQGVVVGEVVTVKAHEQANNLLVCEVNIGKQTVVIVTGASNVRAKMKVPVAGVGAQLPQKPQPLQAVDLKGITSFGMLCARQELELGTSEGIWELPADAPVGCDLREYLQLADTLLEVELTPNRGDCLSMLGLSREIAALNQLNLQQPAIKTVKPAVDDKIVIENLVPDFCPHYVARVIEGIDSQTHVPMWLEERLRRNDIRSIHPVVDILNYVMIELGQPMHAFDKDKLTLPVVIRPAHPDEKIKLLDEREVTLQPDTVVIADQQKAQAIAGIMGGSDSAVSINTRNVLLESALFMPVPMAGRARKYGLHTDSSFRFERGVDPKLQAIAIERATALILEYCGGKPGPVVTVQNKATLPQLPTITLRFERIKKILGIEIDSDTVEDVLTRLGCTLSGNEKKNWQVEPPSFRYDLTQEIDLIEEIIRVVGYDKIPTHLPKTCADFVLQKENPVPLTRLKRALVDLGYQETINYSFVDAQLQKLLFPYQEALPLVNPISAEMGVMRLSLWPGLLSTLKFNQNRQQNRLQLFEAGMCFNPVNQKLHQENWLGGLLCGDVAPEQWGLPSRPADFYDLKHHVESLWQLLGHQEPLTFEPMAHSACHPGQCAQILWQGIPYGIMGKLHPQIQKTLDLEGQIFLFEIKQTLFEAIPLSKFERPSRFPEIRRDIAVVVDESLPSKHLVNYIHTYSGDILRDVRIFDIYTGKGIDSGQKSVALGLILQHPSRTLVDQEVDEVIHRLVAGLEKEFNAKLRE